MNGQMGGSQNSNPKTREWKEKVVTARQERQEDEFAGFVANPQALRRGGRRYPGCSGTTAARAPGTYAQVEANRFWRAEIAARSGQ